MQTSPECDKVLSAFRAALVDCGNVKATKTADTGKFKYTYANLVDVLGTAEAACEAHGLSLSQSLRSEGGVTFVDTMLIHETGQWVIFPGMGMQTDRDPQANGSSTTYMRRYTLTALFAMGVEDDDGMAAKTAARAPAPERAKPATAAPPPASDVSAEVAFDSRQRAKRIMDQLPAKEKAAFANALRELGITSPLNPGSAIDQMEELYEAFLSGKDREEQGEEEPF